ncbi:hypothetical protein [Vampirovibrio chlorellavorus]|uniref:hypothetical protein n=1 Tax=Vampirovibrio chlorellavorus TaxID=758823 RepID=UPI0026EF7E37|nr:hypothetical protein [Vampirovibrio chlorellavorus]
MMTRALIPQAVASPHFPWRHSQHNDGDSRKKAKDIPPLIRPHHPTRPVPSQEKRATTQRVFETLSHESERSTGNPYGLKNYTLKYVLYHPPTQTYFKVDRHKYPQVVTAEQAKLIFENKLQKNPHAGRLSFVDGFHQIKLSAAPLQDKEGRVLVRLKGPILWPLPSEKNSTEGASPADPGSASAAPAKQHGRAYRPWQMAIRRFQSEQEKAKANQSPEMDIVVEFTSLLPDGYTEELEVFPTEDLPKLWSQKRLDLEA